MEEQARVREPHLPSGPSGHLISRRAVIALCVVLVVAATLSIVVPLALTPGVTPRPRAQAASPTVTSTATSLPTPTATPYPLPLWITSPKAHINASVTQVGADANGAMAAPEGPNNDPVWFTTFWWEYGARPGEIGNAVIAGHLDRKDGSPAVFWWLRLLVVGDSVYIRDAAGATLHFVVTDVETYLNPTGGQNDPILQHIFGPATTANLNLITCTGDWTGKEYNKKLVVYTTLASS
jgi:sortase A